MLDKFRRGASKLLASLLFCILIVSFAFWGIPNYNKDYSQSTIAKVGNVTLTEEEYRRFFDQQINVLSAQSGQRLTRENARMFYRFQAMQQGNFTADLDREVLNIQVNQALLDSQAKALGLGLADTAIVDAIRSDPQYQGPDKSFNRALFEDRVRQAGFSDVGYIRERKASDIRGQLTDALSTGLKPSQTLIDIAHKFSEEQRTVTIVTLDPLKQPKIADPDDAKLMQYYELNKRQYSAPEMRKLVLLFLGRDDIKSRAGVEDSEVKSTWERDKTPGTSQSAVVFSKSSSRRS